MIRTFFKLTLALALGLLPLAAEAAPAAGMVSVPVLKAPLDKGTLVTADMLEDAQVPAKAVFPGTIQRPADVLGLQTVRPVAAGEPLNKLAFRLAPTVARGTAVTLLYRKGGIELTSQGQALEDGKPGQAIKVVNTATKTTLVGKVTAPGTVEIQ